MSADRNEEYDSRPVRGRDALSGGRRRHAGAYGFSRVEIGALIVLVLVAGAAGLYRLWQRQNAAPMPPWVVEDVVLESSRSPSPATGNAGGSPNRDTIAPRPVVATQTIDINAATVAALARLPGIGPVLAERIRAEREKRGPFRDLLDLERVNGIGARKAAALAGWVTFKQPVPDTAGTR